jgi:hypothetical protein
VRFYMQSPFPACDAAVSENGREGRREGLVYPWGPCIPYVDGRGVAEEMKSRKDGGLGEMENNTGVVCTKALVLGVWGAKGVIVMMSRLWMVRPWGQSGPCARYASREYCVSFCASCSSPPLAPLPIITSLPKQAAPSSPPPP